MLTYFEKVYIGKCAKNNPSVRKIPVYPIPRWNVVARIEKDKGKTNNSLESWHGVFSMDAKSHPTFTKLVDHFRAEQNNTEVILAQIRSGDKYKPTITQKRKDDAVKDLMANYSFEMLFEYFDNLILMLG
jgi:putative heme degradation protein